MEPEPLLFFDSGVGGLPYLASARQRLPGADYVYLADRLNYPYGEKPAGDLRRLVLEAMGQALERFRPRLVVVACNTASVVALDALRRSYPVPFVGVVPAVKPAAEHLGGSRLGGGRLAVVATRGTVSGEYLRQLVEDYASGVEVLRIPVAELVDYAEHTPPPRNLERDEAMVRRALAPHLRDGLGSVVLGCTHFTLLEEAFRRVLGPGVEVIDSREGVARRVVSLLEQPGATRSQAPEPRSAEGRARLFMRGGAGELPRYRAFAAAFGLEFGGPLEPPGPLEPSGQPAERHRGSRPNAAGSRKAGPSHAGAE